MSTRDVAVLRQPTEEDEIANVDADQVTPITGAFVNVTGGIFST
jgi:hypothetical protein